MMTTPRASIRALATFACAGMVSLLAAPAMAADPPAALPQTPAAPTMPGVPGVPGADMKPGSPFISWLMDDDKDKDAAKKGEKPSLVKQLPIASYVTAPVTAAGGALIFKLLGGGAIEDLKDPSKHKTPDETHSLVVKARVGQVVGGVMFAFTGLSTAWGTFKTIRTLMKFSKMATPPEPPKLGVSVTPGGMAFSLKGAF